MSNKTKTIVYTALFTALTMVGTIIIQVPNGAGGNVNAGDIIIFLSAVIIGKKSIVSASIGSALADLVSAYVIYTPATFVIKGAMALVICIIIADRNSFSRAVIAAVVAELIMIAGYMCFEFFFIDKAIAFASIIPNMIQGFAAIICSAAIYNLTKMHNIDLK